VKVTTRVLIVKLAALGDAIMASTLVPAIRAEWPDAEITWAAGTGILPIVSALDGIDRIIPIDDRALLSGKKGRAGLAMLRAWRSIGRRYDVALVAHTDARYGLLARFSGAKHVRRFADERGPRSGRWHGSEYLRLISDRAAENAAPSFPRLRDQVLPPAPHVAGSGSLVVIAPGGGRNILRDDPLRRWPVESWVTAVRTMVRNGHRVVCVGGRDDHMEAAACASAGAVDLTGQTSMLELLALIESASVVVTHDSGPLHLAILARRPTVALFGPTSPAERIPEWANVSVLSRAAELACAPCYDGYGYAECALNLCLSRVRAADVVRAVEDHLRREQSSGASLPVV
jgi:heptosyltransferase-2